MRCRKMAHCVSESSYEKQKQQRLRAEHGNILVVGGQGTRLYFDPNNDACCCWPGMNMTMQCNSAPSHPELLCREDRIESNERVRVHRHVHFHDFVVDPIRYLGTLLDLSLFHGSISNLYYSIVFFLPCMHACIILYMAFDFRH